MKNATYKFSDAGTTMLKEAFISMAVLSLLTAWFFVLPAKAAAEEAREAGKTVAARVNGVEITTQSVMAMMSRIMAKKGHGDASHEGLKEIRRNALDRLIVQELALRKAKAAGFALERERIDSAIERTKASMGGEEGYRKYLEKEGMTEEELKGQLERSLTLEAILAKEVMDKVTVSEDELRKEYEEDKTKYLKPEKVYIVDVVLFMSPEDSASEAKAEAVLDKIKKDRDANPRNLVPDGTFIVREMDVRKDRDKELYEAARNLREGELSGIIKTPDSLHIVKLIQYTPEKQITFDEARGAIEGTLKARARQKRFREWEAELKQGAEIEIMESENKK
jgi:parvulin-like peptidyl-prolyl isomerase